MDISYLESHVEDLPWNLRPTLLAFARTPTERNECYATGYLAALRSCGVVDDDQYKFWLAIIGGLRDSEYVRKTIMEKLK